MAKDTTGSTEIALPKFVLSPVRGISFKAASSLLAVSTVLDILESTVFMVFTLTNGNGYPLLMIENETVTALGGSFFQAKQKPRNAEPIARYLETPYIAQVFFSYGT